MKFSVLQENLQATLSVLGRVIGSRTSLPVLANVLIIATKKGVELQATNLEVALSCTIGAKVEKEGKLSVPARLLAELTHQLPAGKIQLSSEKDNLTIQAEGFTTTLNGIAASEFPEIPQITPKATLRLQPDNLTKALASVIVAASPDESRPILSGVYMGFTKDGIVLAATDSYRLAENTLKSPGQYEQAIVVPLRTTQELLRIIQASDPRQDIVIRIAETEASFQIGETVIVSQLIEGKYPDYTKIIPATSTTKVVLEREKILGAVRVAALFAQTGAHTIELTIKKNQLTLLSTAAHIGTNEAKLDCKTDRADIDISLNAKYLLDALQVIDASDVTLEFNTKLDPILVRPVTKANHYLHIIMPLRS